MFRSEPIFSVSSEILGKSSGSFLRPSWFASIKSLLLGEIFSDSKIFRLIHSSPIFSYGRPVVFYLSRDSSDLVKIFAVVEYISVSSVYFRSLASFFV